MKFDLGEVLTRMWKIGWNHKVLWLWQMLPGAVTFVVMPLFILSNPGFLMMMPEPFSNYADESWILLIFSGLMIVVTVLSMLLGTIAQLTTVYGALKVEQGAEKLTFIGLLNESKPYFWRILGLYAIFVGAWMVLYFAVMFFFMAGSMLTMGLATLCFMPFFLLLLPVMLVGYSVLELAQAAIIADDMRTFHSISHGWKLFRENWLGVTLLMLILYFGLTALSSVAVFPIMAPMMAFPIMTEIQGNINNFMMIFLLVLFPLALFLMVIIQGILMAFFQSAWAVTYLRITRGGTSTPQA